MRKQRPFTSATAHKLTERLTATVMGQAQISTFDGGGPGYNGESEDFYVLQVNLAYHFNPNWLAEAGYNYSNLRSDLLLPGLHAGLHVSGHPRDILIKNKIDLSQGRLERMAHTIWLSFFCEKRMNATTTNGPREIERATPPVVH